MSSADKTMDFIAPFGPSEPDSGLCVLPRAQRRDEPRAVAFAGARTAKDCAAVSMSLSPDRRFCAVAGGNTATVFRLGPLAPMLVYKKPSHTYTFTDIVWSPHGLHLTSLPFCASCTTQHLLSHTQCALHETQSHPQCTTRRS